MKIRLQKFLAYERYIWTSDHTRLMHGLTICVKSMKIKNKVKDIVRLKFAQTSNKIIKLASSKYPPIKFLPLKCLT